MKTCYTFWQKHSGYYVHSFPTPQKTKIFIRSCCELMVFRDMKSCSLINRHQHFKGPAASVFRVCSTLKMEAPYSCDFLVPMYKTALCYFMAAILYNTCHVANLRSGVNLLFNFYPALDSYCHSGEISRRWWL